MFVEKHKKQRTKTTKAPTSDLTHVLVWDVPPVLARRGLWVRRPAAGPQQGSETSSARRQGPSASFPTAAWGGRSAPLAKA